MFTIDTLFHQHVPLAASISHPLTAFYPSTSSLQTTNLVLNSYICRSGYLIMYLVSTTLEIYKPSKNRLFKRVHNSASQVEDELIGEGNVWLE
ncbi:unnamed protein product [Sphenostylis stenocarpa]|uniref:Uncharacterized protein n=1 Tax=Sphenostylis stenocarpa TaxID=92480 RepID=A0AA86V4W5_9FABA|nr:unnamed protein product [Sphenostylis stenocarpa]